MPVLNDAIVRLYDTVFDRAPDAGGLADWNAAADAGMPLHDIASYFVVSPEFQGTYGQPDNFSFVMSLYQNVLGRGGEAEGVNAWLEQLNTGAQDRASVTIGFSESAEHVAQMHWGLSIDGPHMFFGSIEGDMIQGTDGPDRIVGVSSDQMTNATLSGVMIPALAQQDGGDWLMGGNGHDTLEGGWGNDRLEGGWGDDVLIGGATPDGLFGGPGNDRYVFQSIGDAHGDGIVFGGGNDVLDFRGLGLAWRGTDAFVANGAPQIRFDQQAPGTGTHEGFLLPATVIIDGDGNGEGNAWISVYEHLTGDNFLL